jgi:5,10-methylenetetrahydromethanopterin reductase
VAELPKMSVRLSGATNPRHCIELAKIAEANGYHCVWFAENAFGRGVLPAASACAMATQRVGIGIGVFNPYNRHPTLMAMEIGALDELAQGRARLGIGSGIAASTERIGLSTDRPLAAVRDAITIVRAMLKGEEVHYAGRVFSARNVKLEYQALRPDMPLLMAARGEQALALCGKIADGLMISNMCPAEFTQAAVLAVREAARQAQRAMPAEVVQYVPCAVRLDRAEAYGLAKAAIGEMLPSFWSLGERIPAAKVALLRAKRLSEKDLTTAVARLRAGERAAYVLDDRFVEAFTIGHGRRRACPGAPLSRGRRERTRAHLRRPPAGTGHAISGECRPHRQMKSSATRSVRSMRASAAPPLCQLTNGSTCGAQPVTSGGTYRPPSCGPSSCFLASGNSAARSSFSL